MTWLPEHYQVEATTHNGSIVNMSNSTWTNKDPYKVTSLQPGTVYSISVTPCNIVGCNKSCDIHTVQTIERGELCVGRCMHVLLYYIDIMWLGNLYNRYVCARGLFIACGSVNKLSQLLPISSTHTLIRARRRCIRARRRCIRARRRCIRARRRCIRARRRCIRARRRCIRARRRCWCTR